MPFTAEQQRNAQVIYQTGISVGASTRDIQVALMAALVESGLRNVDYGDRDSIGLFQQRDAWGSRSARLDPATAARMFFLGGAGGQEGLLDISNRGARSLGSLAQDVQVSAYPERYAEHQAEAAALMQGIDPDAPVVTTAPVTGAAEGGLLPGTEVHAPSTAEVNGAGEITADETGLGALSFDGDGNPMTADGPLDALTFGMTPAQSAMQNGSAGDPGTVAQGGGGGSYDPMSSSYMPSLSDFGIDTAPTGPGDTTIADASFQGKDPWEKVSVEGHTIDNFTAAALQAATKEAGTDWHIMQGSYSTSVAASGSTHAGGGVIDIAPTNGDWQGAVTALRKIGFAAWIRNEPGHGYAGSGVHIHAVLIGDENLSSSAATQVQSYLNNDDGLSGSRADDGPRDYVNNRFSWDAVQDVKPTRTGHRESVDKAMNLLGVPFAWGGEDYTGLDAIGLVRKVYENSGVEVPRYFNLFELGKPLDPKEIAPGDMVAWDKHPDSGLAHVGIYVGDGQYISAYGPGSAVQVDMLNSEGLTIFPGPTSMNQSYPGGASPAPHNPFPHGTSSATPSGAFSGVSGSSGSGVSGTASGGGGGRHHGGGGHHQPETDEGKDLPDVL